nr:hypothetical protein [Propionicimonas sp.]
MNDQRWVVMFDQRWLVVIDQRRLVISGGDVRPAARCSAAVGSVTLADGD